MGLSIFPHLLELPPMDIDKQSLLQDKLLSISMCTTVTVRLSCWGLSTTQVQLIPGVQGRGYPGELICSSLDPGKRKCSPHALKRNEIAIISKDLKNQHGCQYCYLYYVWAIYRTQQNIYSRALKYCSLLSCPFVSLIFP